MTSLPAAPRATDPQGGTELFTTLVASRPEREGRAGAVAGFVSILAHVGVVALLFWATMNVGEAVELERMTMIELFPEPEPEPIPPAPEAPVVDEPPEPVAAEEPAFGFQMVTPPDVILPDIPPPSNGPITDPRDYRGIGTENGRANGDPDRVVTADDVDAAPRITPMDVAPRIRNPEEVARALRRFYPPLLRDAGIGDTVVIWIRVDAEGQVVRTQVHRPSDHAGLDDAALRVGEVIEFTPAQNGDRPVAVWVQQAIVFRPTTR